MAEATPSRAESIRILEEGRAEIDALLAEVPKGDLERPGIGGGAWSPKDLLGHLATWEEHALDALEAWSRGERAPIDRELSSRRLSDINADAVALMAVMSYVDVRIRAGRIHGLLAEAIRATPDDRWNAPATPRGRKPIGARLGGILAGAGPFGHAQAHVASFRGFLDVLASRES